MKTKVSFLKKSSTKKSVVVPLTLTSLVDAFCMLLIYLIMATSADTSMEPTEGIKLPEVTKAEVIIDAPTISVSGNKYLFQNRLFDLSALKAQVLAQKNLFAKHKAIIEADQSTPYSSIEPLMAVMSELDVESIQLAVSAQENQ